MLHAHISLFYIIINSYSQSPTIENDFFRFQSWHTLQVQLICGFLKIGFADNTQKF